MSPFLQQLRQLPRPFWVLAGATFVNRFGVFVWPFITVFATARGNTPEEAGWAIAVMTLGSVIAAGLGGWLADRIGRNVTMAVSSIGGAACLMLLSQATDWGTLAVIGFFWGLIADSGHPATVALVQDIVPEGQRVAAFAALRFAVNLGWSFGPAVAGFLAERDFFWLFVVDAITSALFGIVALVALPAGARSPAHRSGWKHAWPSIRSNRAFLALFTACVLVSWNFRQSSTTFVLHMGELGHARTWTGLVLALNGVMICLLEVPLAAMTSRIAARLMLAAGYALMGVSYLILLGSGSLAGFFATMVLFTLGEMCAFSRQQAYAAGLAPHDMRGRYAGFLSLAWGIGGILASAGGLRLYEQNPSAVWVVSAALGLAAALLIAFRSGSVLSQQRDGV